MDNYRLWYKQPAELFEEALPLGNGHMGMMVYGGIRDELIELNNDTLWSGYPRKYYNRRALHCLEQARKLINEEKYNSAQKLIESQMLGQYGESYMPLGNIRLQFRYNGCLKKSDYKRSLELSSATVKIEYKIDGNKYIREGFVTNPDNVGVYRIKSESRFDLMVSLDSKLLYDTKTENTCSIIMTGTCPEHVEPSYNIDSFSPIVYERSNSQTSLKFGAMTKILCDGYISDTGAGILIRSASEVLLITATETTYNGFNKEFKDLQDILKTIKQRIANAEKTGYKELYKRHLQDYRNLYNRVEFSLGEDKNANVPTDIRLENLREGKEDLGIISVYFQYGRYLLIASSREGSQPANLQGIWNYEVRPPWSSNYTSNINVQMNYWLAENCNLSECHEPLIQMVKELSVNGAETAKIYFGCRGWTAAHNIDLWRRTDPTEGNAQYAFWPMAGPWLCRHLYEHYEYNQNKEYLKEVYPIIKGAALFCMDWLVEDESGYLVTSPSTSPENAFYTPSGEVCSVSKASTMDMTLIREIFNTCIEICNILDTDLEFSEGIKQILPKLYPYKIGKYDQLQEWFEDFEETQKGHRHQSHLYGLHPGNIINENTPELYEACRKSLQRRMEYGGGYTGWSCAWFINLFARLKENELAGKYVEAILTRSTYPNMFDAHPPFQIDGNFGATAGICEMLIQSHMGYIEVLPAIPEKWKSGYIKGVKVRGGYEVDLEWNEGKLTKILVRSDKDKEIKIKYRGKDIKVKTNEEKIVDGDDK